jgi:hypothetical protein
VHRFRPAQCYSRTAQTDRAWRAFGQSIGHDRTHHLMSALSTAHHLRSDAPTCLPASTRTACRRRSMRLILSLLVRRRSKFPPLPAIAVELSPTLPSASAPITEHWPPSTALVCPHRCLSVPCPDLMPTAVGSSSA